jgi:acetoacetate decarboxylase
MTVKYCTEKVSNLIQLALNGRLISVTGKGDPSKGTYCFATTNVSFWAKREAWEIPRRLCTIYTTTDSHTFIGEIPYFLKRCAITRELYDLIVELRPSSTSAGLAENIKRKQTHFWNNRHPN